MIIRYRRTSSKMKKEKENAIKIKIKGHIDHDRKSG
jgi:hypothetical protein